MTICRAVAACAVFCVSLSLCQFSAAQLGAAPGLGPCSPEPSPYSALAGTVTSMIAPSSWSDLGGPGELEVVAPWGLMVVSQTDHAHRHIEELLRVIRAARQLQRPNSPMGFHMPGSADMMGMPGMGMSGMGDGMMGMGRTSRTARPTSMVVESESAATSRARIQAALDSPVTIDFTEVSLQDAIHYISEEQQIPIHIDRPALAEIGLSSDMPVSVRGEDITLRSILNLMLRDNGLSYLIRDEVLQITSEEVAESVLTTRVYLVTDLVAQ